MTYTYAMLNSSGHKSFPYFKLFSVGNMSDACLGELFYRFHSDTFLLALLVPRKYQTE